MHGEEARVSNVCWCSWSNVTYNCVCAHLDFIVHNLCHYCGMVLATAAGNKHAFGGGQLQVKDEVSTS